MAEHLTELGTLRKYSYTLIAAWTIMLAGSLAFLARNQFNQMERVAGSIARASHDKDIVYRAWNASHGGVYVPVTENTPPNPYLDVPGKEVATTDGLRLTLMNPAYMTRQVHELGAQRYGIRGHITSLDPVRPGNAPDEWERKALAAASGGKSEIIELVPGQGELVLRYMKTMITEEACLKCHAAQGYALGDVRGGISVSVPMSALSGIYAANIGYLSLAHAVVWLLGMGGILHGRRLLAGQIAHRIQLHEKAEAAKALAEAADRSKSEFLSTMSHEIRTPLNGIMGMLQLTRESDLDAEQAENLELALESSRRLLTILNDILDLSRMEAGRLEIHLAEAAPAALARSVAGMFERAVAAKGLTLQVDTDDASMGLVVSDEARIRQILFNLLGNAVKFTDSGGVNLSVYMLPTPGSAASHRLVMEVGDTGPGIPTGRIDAMFQPFTQLEEGPRRRHGGVGLGLSIVARLVRQLGGGLDVSTEPDEGCVMAVSIPVNKADRGHLPATGQPCPSA